jgi:hypothetical protein
VQPLNSCTSKGENSLTLVFRRFKSLAWHLDVFEHLDSDRDGIGRLGMYRQQTMQACENQCKARGSHVASRHAACGQGATLGFAAFYLNAREVVRKCLCK